MKISRPRATQLSQIDIDVDLAMGAHNITLGAGQLVDGVDVSTIESYVHDGTLVLDGGVSPSPNPSAWTDLDLSARVGTNISLVVLKIETQEAGGVVDVGVRPNGDTSEYAGDSEPAGASGGRLDSGVGKNEAMIVILETDANGIIEWYADQAALDIDITLLGYFV